MAVTLSIVDVAMLLLGIVAGWGLSRLVRRYRIKGLPCRFCNGNGYFLSTGHEASVMDQVHSESASFKP